MTAFNLIQSYKNNENAVIVLCYTELMLLWLSVQIHFHFSPFFSQDFILAEIFHLKP